MPLLAGKNVGIACGAAVFGKRGHKHGPPNLHIVSATISELSGMEVPSTADPGLRVRLASLGVIAYPAAYQTMEEANNLIRSFQVSDLC